MAMLDDKVEGYFLLGQNPAVGSANGRLQRLGMANLKWLVVRDLDLIETATFWKDGPEIATGELRTEDIGTEVFFLPGRRARREGRHVHPDPADAAVAPQGRRARRATPAATCGSSTTWAGRSGRSSPAPPTRATGRCST